MTNTLIDMTDWYWVEEDTEEDTADLSLYIQRWFEQGQPSTLHLDHVKPQEMSLLLTFINEHPKITSLFIRRGLGDAGAVYLSGNKTLQSLNLVDCNIGDKGAESLARMPLEELKLDRNHISDEGVAALAKSPTIKKMSLRFNSFGDAGAEALASNKILMHLDVSDSKITKKGAAALIRSRLNRMRAMDIFEDKMLDASMFIKPEYLSLKMDPQFDIHFVYDFDYMCLEPQAQKIKEAYEILEGLKIIQEKTVEAHAKRANTYLSATSSPSPMNPNTTTIHMNINESKSWKNRGQ